MVSELLAEGADVESKDKDERTALISGTRIYYLVLFNPLVFSLASMRGYLNVVRELLAGGAYIESKDKDGYTALFGGIMIDYSFH